MGGSGRNGVSGVVRGGMLGGGKGVGVGGGEEGEGWPGGVEGLGLEL